MSPAAVGIIGFVVLLSIMFLRVPIGVSMALVGIIGFAYLTSAGAAYHMAASSFYSLFFSYNWSVIPLFMLMGLILSNAGVGAGIYRTANSWVGHLPGGLAMANVVGSGLFGSICASATATVVTMGTVALPEMKRYNYDPALSAGCVAAAGTLGIIFPPSVTFIIYGIIAQESIGKLFIAGIGPGLVIVGLFCAIIYVLARRNPRLAPPGSKASWRERLSSLKGVGEPLVLFVLIFGGIFAGFFTPTEAAAVGAFGALIIVLVRRRLSWEKFIASVLGTLTTSCFVYFLIAGATIFGYFLARTNLSFELASWVSELAIPRIGILAAIIIVYLIFGSIIEALPLIVLTVPVFLPVINLLGFDPIWFGVLIVVLAQVALITPPVGVVTLVVAGMVKKDVPMLTVFRGVIPFVLAMVVVLVILVAFPEISLFLPGLMS